MNLASGVERDNQRSAEPALAGMDLPGDHKPPPHAKPDRIPAAVGVVLWRVVFASGK